ncbi:MAG: hypothetical protein ACT4ON_12255 [Bacteroidota bacterium]
MDKFKVRKEIAALIDSIKEHSDNIGDNKHVPQLELELILNKIKNLYEKSIVFNHLNTLPENPQVNETISASDKKDIPLKPGSSTSITPVDLFGSELPPITEKQKPEKRIEKKEEKPVINKIQKPAISDLKSAIGINDQFQFANELFAGSMQEYAIAVQQLNTAESLESAIDYFSNLQQLYNWDEKNETAKRLLDLIDRRYSV